VWSVKKKVYISIGVIILLILIWGGYKAFLLYKYSTTDIAGMENLNNIEEIYITTNKSKQNTTIENMNLYIPEKFEESTKISTSNENTKSFSIIGEDEDNYTQTILVGVTKNAIESTIENNLSYFKNIDYEKLMNKYNVTNEIDLIKYYEQNKDIKSNIFWSKSHIQFDCLVNQYIALTMTLTKNSAYLTNDLNGFITYNSGNYYVKIANNDEIYYLTISSRDNSFTYDEVLNILESISFE
jgi:hypothetical protein